MSSGIIPTKKWTERALNSDDILSTANTLPTTVRHAELSSHGEKIWR